MTLAALASLALRITVIIGVAAITNIVRQRANAGSRHWLWMFALIGAAILPLAQRITPQARILPWQSGAATVEQPVSFATQAVPLIPENTAEITTSVSRADTRAGLSPVLIVLLVWIGGTIALSVRLLRAHVRAAGVVKRSREWPTSSHVPTRISSEVDMPFTYGLAAPVIVMPESIASWPDSQLTATLLHEESHADRGDTLALLISQVICALYWWHPAVWYAARHASAERERACDDAVIRHGVRASEYGQCLLAHARSLAAWGRSPVATVMFGHSAGLGARVVALLDPAIDRSAGLRPKLRVIGGMAALVAIAGAASPRSVESVKDVISPASLSPVVSMAIVPVEPAKGTVPSTARAVLSQQVDAASDAGVCRQAPETSNSRTYKDAIVSITGAGSRDANGVTREIWTGVDCIAWIEFNKNVSASLDERMLVVQGNGRVIAHNEGPDGTREYHLTSSSSSMTLNGSNVAIGASEEAWIGAMTREYLRRTGQRVHERAVNALKGGTQALIAEASLVPRRRTRADYLREGFSATNTPESAVSFIHQAAAILDSSDTRGFFLTNVPHKFDSNLKVLQAIYEEASVIEPDGALEEVLESYPPPRPLPQSLSPLVEKMIASLQTAERRTALRAYYMNVRP